MFWKRFFIVIGILVILAFVAQLLSAPYVKGLLIKATKEYLGAEVSIGDCALSVLRQKIILKDIAVLNPDNKDDYLLRAKEISVDFYLLPLLFNRQVLRTVAFTNPEVILYLDEGGKLKIPELKKGKKAPKKKSGEFLFKRLVVTGGNFKFIDRQVSKPATITQFSGIDGSIVNSVSLADRTVITSINVKGRIEGQGTFSIDGKGELLDKPISFDGTIKIEDIPLAKFSPYYGSNLSVKVKKGNLFADTKAGCDRRNLNVKTDVRIEDVDLEPVGDPTQTVLFEIKTQDVIDLLKDENNAVRFSFEIEGDLNKPDFKWGAEMAKALRNSMLRALGEGVIRSPEKAVEVISKAGEAVGNMIGDDAGEAIRKLGEKINKGIEKIKGK